MALVGDDTTHWINSFFTDSATLIQQSSATAQAWEQLLFGSGGKLELPKCFTYHLKWTTDKQGLPTMDHSNGHTSIITIIDSTSQQPSQIESLPTNKAHKTLGIMESPCGNNSEETLRLQNISARFARIISTTTISATDSAQLYFTYFLPSITYALTVGTQTMQQLHSIQSPVTFAILSALGLNQHTPGEIAFGPTSLGGKGLRHLFSEQGTIKVKAIMKHIRTPRRLGILLRIKFAWDQLISGQGHSILMAPFYHCAQLQGELWTTTLQEFLYESELELLIPAHRLPMLRRVHDWVLMDKLYAPTNQHFDNTDIQFINHCRTYLRVETLADITNAAGTHIQQSAFNCTIHGSTISSYLWPHTTLPIPKHINQWKRFLRIHCKTDSLELRQPLLQWISSYSPQQWTAYVDNDCTFCILQKENRWFITHLGPMSRHGYPIQQLNEHDIINTDLTKLIPSDQFSNASEDTYIIPTLQMTIDSESTYTDYSDSESDASYEPCHHQTNTDFSKHLAGIPKWERELLQNIRFVVPINTLNRLLSDRDTTIFIVSDGGNREDYGSFGWTIATHHSILITNHGPAFGHPMSSYRAEAYGKL